MPPIVDILVLFVFGTILGSFINALSFRFQSSRSMWGRSACMTCNRTLTAGDLVPLLSFLFLKGRCRSCRARISLQYPLVEVLAGILTVLSYIQAHGRLEFILILAFFQILLFISIYDLRHTIIPDSFVYTAGLIGIAMIGLRANWSVSALDPYTLFAGPVLALPIALIWFFSRGRAMGLGDAKLFLAVGWFLGLSGGIAAFMLSFWIGAIIGLVLIAYSRREGLGFKMRSELPFGPFIVTATVIAYFAHINLNALLSFF